MRVPEYYDETMISGLEGKKKKWWKKIGKALPFVKISPHYLLLKQKEDAAKKKRLKKALVAARAAAPAPTPEQQMPGDEYVTQPMTSQPPYAAPAGYNWILANPGTRSQQWTLIPAQTAPSYYQPAQVQPPPSYPAQMPSYPPAQTYAPASSYYPSSSYQRPAAPSMPVEYGDEGGEEGAETWEDQAPSFEKRGIAPPSAPEGEYAEEGGGEAEDRGGESEEEMEGLEKIKLPSGKVRYRKKGRSLMRVPMGFNEVAYHNGLGYFGQAMTSAQVTIARKLEDLVRLANRTLPTSRTAVANLLAIAAEISVEAKATLPEPLNYSISDGIDLGIIQHTQKWITSNSPASWKKAWDSLRQRSTSLAQAVKGEKPAGIVQPVMTVMPEEPRKPEVKPEVKPAGFDFKKLIIPALIVVGAVVVAKTVGKRDEF